jgi:hypothetical protein
MFSLFSLFIGVVLLNVGSFMNPLIAGIGAIAFVLGSLSLARM